MTSIWLVVVISNQQPPLPKSLAEVAQGVEALTTLVSIAVVNRDVKN